MRIIDDLVDDSAPMNVKSSLGADSRGTRLQTTQDRPIISATIPARRRERPQDHVYFHRPPKYQAWRRYETVRRELSQLTDRDLADIGITRSDIDRIASREARS
jgi:uncharacterized protein YjiS (DUF1127 family)